MPKWIKVATPIVVSSVLSGLITFTFQIPLPYCMIHSVILGVAGGLYAAKILENET